MTTNLRTITASKTDLEREIIERKKAEEALQRAKSFSQKLSIAFHFQYPLRVLQIINLLMPTKPS